MTPTKHADACIRSFRECMNALPLMEGQVRDMAYAECISLASICFRSILHVNTTKSAAPTDP
jgi:hypothetical protein